MILLKLLPKIHALNLVETMFEGRCVKEVDSDYVWGDTMQAGPFPLTHKSMEINSSMPTLKSTSDFLFCMHIYHRDLAQSSMPTI